MARHERGTRRAWPKTLAWVTVMSLCAQWQCDCECDCDCVQENPGISGLSSRKPPPSRSGLCSEMWSKTVFATGKAAATCVQENPGISGFSSRPRSSSPRVSVRNVHRRIQRTSREEVRKDVQLTKKTSNGRKVIQRTYTSNGPKIRTRPTDRRNPHVKRTDETQRTYTSNVP